MPPPPAIRIVFRYRRLRATEFALVVNSKTIYSELDGCEGPAQRGDR
jgi:hypothetical protein